MEDNKIKRQRVYKVIMLVVLTATIVFMLTTFIMYNKFKEAYENLKENNPTGLIIDLRNNGGGLVTESLDIAETIEERGTCIRNNYGSVIVKNDEIIGIF